VPPDRKGGHPITVSPVEHRTSTLPTGTVTFLFTDVEGSTRLWDAFPDDMRAALAIHDEILTSAAEANGGTVVKHTGDGLFMAFGSATGATHAAVDAQRRLAAAGWPDIIGALQVRMALHTAEVSPSGDDYLSPEVNRVARIEAAGHGGQVLLSGSTSRLVAGALPAATHLVDLGTHPLRGLRAPEHIHQLTVEELPAVFPPLRTEAAIKGYLPAFSTGFVGRRRELDDLISLALEPTTRVVSVVGNGGMGKTRIAVEAARRIAEHNKAIAHFVPLESITTDAAMTSAIASSLGFGVDLHLSGSFGERAQLFDYLRAHDLVLVLDNLEQIPGAGDWVAALVSEVASVTVLATSRERLRVTAETVFPLSGLDASADAVALFCDRCASAGAPVGTDAAGVADCRLGADAPRRRDRHRDPSGPRLPHLHEFRCKRPPSVGAGGVRADLAATGPRCAHGPQPARGVRRPVHSGGGGGYRRRRPTDPPAARAVVPAAP
jgi:class 3 adenylate cyclase